MQIRLRFVSSLILLQVNLVGLAEDLPIDVPDVVAGDVRPVLGKLDGDALIRRAVHAGHQAFDDQRARRSRLLTCASVRGSR